ADGLKKGDEVRLAGKLVGKVENVDFGAIPVSENDKPIVVTMSLDSDEVQDRIRRDSKAVLAQQGFLGDRVVDITPGTRDKEPIPSGGEIPSADQAGLSKVFEGANDILTQFNTVGKQLHDDALYVNLNRTVVEFQDIAGRVGKGTGTIAKLLNDPKLYDDFRGVTNDFKGIVTDLRAGKGTLGKLMTDEQFYRQANDLLAKFNTTA